MSGVVNHRTLRRGLFLSVPVVLVLGGLARAAQSGEAGQDAPHLWIGLDGGWARACSQLDVKDAFPWFEAGLRVVFLP